MPQMTLEQVRDWHTKCAVVYEQSGESALADQHRSLAAAITAHLTQPAQSVDVEKVREVIATLYEWPVCADPTELADKLTAALQEKGNG